ncbi:MAG: pyrimidine dimer DNA glycosylase/endonuclease V [Gemmatimonadales bacterium]
MRLWTLHPKYLDAKGLVALWREGLLARAVLLGRTRGYRHHPQLIRFQRTKDPVAAINRYLQGVLDEARARGYHFNAGKIRGARARRALVEHRGQLAFEWQHLLRKLRRRDRVRHSAALTVRRPAPHPLFRIRPGPVQEWEKAK